MPLLKDLDPSNINPTEARSLTEDFKMEEAKNSSELNVNR